MIKKISKNHFKEQLKHVLVEGIVPEIAKDDIHEFYLEGNYFYKITDKYINNIHDWLNNYFQLNIPLNSAVTAFRKDLSYLNFFEPHKNSYHFLRLDIKSFFHSISIEDIKIIFLNYFENDYIDENKKQLLIDSFINIISYRIPSKSNNEFFRNKLILPIGFKTSPIISNIIFRKLDIQIQNFCSMRNITYTRYADDMLFSSNEKMTYIHSDNFTNEIKILLSQMNFKLNKRKTLKSKHTLSLNGYTIQYSTFIKGAQNIINDKEFILNEFRLSNKKINIIKKLIHLCHKKLKPIYILKKLFNYKLPYNVPSNKIDEYSLEQLLNKITGYRSYLLSMILFNNKYNCCKKNTINKYSLLIKKLNSLISSL